MKVYIINFEEGEYEDYSLNTIEAFLDKKKAYRRKCFLNKNDKRSEISLNSGGIKYSITELEIKE